MLVDFTKNFLTGGLLSALIAWLATIGNTKLLNLSAFIYAAPTVFFYLINIVWMKTNRKTALEFSKHCIYGTIMSGFIVLINYYYLIRKYSRKNVLIINIIMLSLILFVYQILF